MSNESPAEQTERSEPSTSSGDPSSTPSPPSTSGSNAGGLQNPKDIEARQLGKTRWDLLPYLALEEVVRVLEEGAKRPGRGEWNWRDAPPAMTTYFAACQRHLIAWMQGEDAAADTGLSHLAHAIACLLIIKDAIGINKVIDDRRAT